MELNSPWLTIEEAADYMRCSIRYLQEKVANKEIPHTRFGGKTLFNKHRIDEWLLSLEESCGENSEKANTEILPQEKLDTSISSDCDSNKVDELVERLVNYEDSFVSRLGNNLASDLQKFEYKKLSEKVYAQLSRWCHPNRNSVREKQVQPIAQEVSRILFGRVIKRTKHPSYGG